MRLQPSKDTRNAKLKETDKDGNGSKGEDICFNFGDENHFIGDCTKPRNYDAFVSSVWSDDEDHNQANKEETCLMAIESHKVQHNSSIYETSFDIRINY